MVVEWVALVVVGVLALDLLLVIVEDVLGGRRRGLGSALDTLEEYGWARRSPRPSLTDQGRAALGHDRSLRFDLVANAMEAMLRAI